MTVEQSAEQSATPDARARIAMAREQRWMFLEALYHLDPHGQRMPTPQAVGETCGLHGSLADPILKHVTAPLQEEGLLTGTAAYGGGLTRVRLTDRGRRLVEEKLAGVDGLSPTPRPGGGVHVSGTGHTVAVQQYSPGASQNLTVAAAAAPVQAWAQQVLDAAPTLDLSPEDLEEIRDALTALRDEAQASAPDAGRMARGVRHVRRVLQSLPAGVAGNVIASGLIATAGELITALGS